MVAGIKIGILVCYDHDFPDYPCMLFRSHCDSIFDPLLMRKDFHSEWHTYIELRVLENRMPVISVNSISDDFLGTSIIAYSVGEEDGVGIKTITSSDRDIVFNMDTSDYSIHNNQRLKERI